MDPQTKSVNLQKRSYEGIAIFIAIFSLLAAIVGVTLQFRAEKTRELTCNVTSINELTAVSVVPELTSRFVYKDKEVAHLWKLALSCVNTGSETLIGQGPHNTLMGDGLSFDFPKDTEILNFELTNSDVTDISIEQSQAETNGGITGQNQTSGLSAQGQPNRFRLKFSQWRRAEKVNLSMYLTSANRKASPLLPVVTTRDIVDGNVLVKHSPTQLDQKSSLIDRLPWAASVTVKLFISIVCGFLVWFGFYIVPKNAVQFLRIAAWKKRNRPQYTKYLETLPEISKYLMKYYLSRPQSLPDEKWEAYPGERLKIGQADFDSFSELTTFGIAGLLLGVAGAIYILSNAVDMYRFIFARLS